MKSRGWSNALLHFHQTAMCFCFFLFNTVDVYLQQCTVLAPILKEANYFLYLYRKVSSCCLLKSYECKLYMIYMHCNGQFNEERTYFEFHTSNHSADTGIRYALLQPTVDKHQSTIHSNDIWHLVVILK